MNTTEATNVKKFGGNELLENGITLNNPYPKAFFHLQGEYAARYAQLSGVLLSDAYERSTCFRSYFSHDTLTSYAQLEEEKQAVFQAVTHVEASNLVYEKYQRTFGNIIPGSQTSNWEVFGCWTFRLQRTMEGHQYRLHFLNNQNNGENYLLRRDAIPQRRAELKALIQFLLIESNSRTGIMEVGSWLYNLPNYRNLMPVALQESLHEADQSTYLNSMGLWGQFLRGNNSIKEPETTLFRQRVFDAKIVEDLIAAFPNKVLEGSCKFEEYCKHFGLE
jgi:hypothetical protein